MPKKEEDKSAVNNGGRADAGLMVGKQMAESYERLIREYADRVDVLQKENAVLHSQHEFIKMLSHQLRTPISVIKLGLETMNSVSETDRKNMVSEMTRRTDNLSDIIDNFLLYTEASYGYSVGSSTSFPLAEMVRKEVKSEHKLEEDKKIRPELDLDDAVMVSGDKRAIAWVLKVLISNAIWYTRPEGRVVISVKSSGDAARFTVSDTGIGIPAPEQDKIFSPFFRATNASLGKNEGDGVSLNLARRIVETHGGKIGFTSEEWKGSTFWFELPLAR